MKILHVLAQLPLKTGSGVYYSNVIQGLKEFNHDQRGVFAFQQENKFQILDAKDQYPVEFQTETLPFPIAGMSDVMPYENTLYSEMDDEMIGMWKDSFRNILLEVKEEFDPDVIISHHLWMLSSIVIEVFPQTYTVGVCHNTDLRQAAQHSHLKEQHAYNLTQLDKVFSLSPLQIPEINEIYDIPLEKIRVMGGGFNHHVFFPVDDTERQMEDPNIRIVFCGKIDTSKGVYSLISVFHHLAEKYSQITLDIIGSPNKKNQKLLEATVRNHPRIRIYDVKNQIDLGELLRKKDIFVMPSFYEGLGLMAIESLASGLWTVATEIEGLMSLLGEDLNSSGVIEYVEMPRIYDTDKAVEEDLPKFHKNLYTATEKQIHKVFRKERISPQYMESINQHSWRELIKRINAELREAP